ncbi:MAG TPA: MauE/DoxX family redox-associated membrane protein [Lacipirellulaceae bacterium]|nr:MauE/DoxX family redox-associated membrane protein [Lacipirellulaceae bacterium]
MLSFASQIGVTVVSVVLLFSGIVHAAQPYYFVHAISGYQLLPAQVAGLLGLWLPYLQIVLALCIGLGIAERVALATAALMFVAFALAQLSVLLRGMEIDCGCFGFVSVQVSPASVGLSLSLAAACAVLFVYGVSRTSNDPALQRAVD